MTYYLFEKDLTSNHVSYHYCFLTGERKIFPEKSKIKSNYQYVNDIFENYLNDVTNFSSFHKAITPQNKFIDVPYFHLSLNASDKDFKIINDCFKINTPYRYCYFTKKIPNLLDSVDFKCGFTSDQFLKIDHKMKSEAIELSKKFFGHYTNVLYAFDFDKNGNILDDNINIELLPIYCIDSFNSIKNILLDIYPYIDKTSLTKYEKHFLNYSAEKFHFHFKIKLFVNGKETIKFYRTYNSSNPYLNQNKYK